MLQLANRRSVPALDVYSTTDLARPWLSASDFSELERRQLLVNVLRLDDRSDLTEADVWEGDLAFFDRHFDAMAEASLEWWDVVDEAGTVRFQLWICSGDGGTLIEAGSARAVRIQSQRCCDFALARRPVSRARSRN
ncbi:MAG: hypothetical protein ACI8S6_003425 [Myxococcota bacterium]|jgi:hypothetical protein